MTGETQVRIGQLQKRRIRGSMYLMTGKTGAIGNRLVAIVSCFRLLVTIITKIRCLLRQFESFFTVFGMSFPSSFMAYITTVSHSFVPDFMCCLIAVTIDATFLTALEFQISPNGLHR
jgi:hypothetical protein